MSDTGIEHQAIRSLKEFYGLMADTRTLKAGMAQSFMAGLGPPEDGIARLKTAFETLKALPGRGTVKRLAIDATRSMETDLSYEINELAKDIDYLSNGEDAFVKSLEALHPDFSPQVEAGVRQLEGKRFRAFVTDRDGTTNNYCGRYLSSVQSVYNAMFLARFTSTRTKYPIMLTSAPLSAPGLTDVSVMPEHTMIYAASKGREFIDLAGKRRHFAIEPAKQALLARLHGEIAALLLRPEYEKYGLIGSGLQFKFGQITVARQDIGGSASPEESLAFLKRVTALVRTLDPDGSNLRIEDTGLDIEIILTIGDAKSGLKDFDKGDGVRYLDAELGMELEKGPHLVCGDTGSDLPMLAAALEKTPDTWSIFVTRKPELADRVREMCPGAVIVPEPDILVTILKRLSETD